MKYKFKQFLNGVLLFLMVQLSAQTITGGLNLSTNDTVQLYGFNGFTNYFIAQSVTDANGLFSISYTKSDTGMGYLQGSDGKPFILVLSGEDVKIKGEALGLVESMIIEKGNENQAFVQYAIEHPRREQTLSAWDYLEKIYTLDPLFMAHKTPNEVIQKEKQRIRKEDSEFLDNLPKDSYISWYLPVRKLVSSVSVIAQYRSEEIPTAVDSFRKIDYSDPRLYKSGLYKDVLDSHYWLLENSGIPLDSVYMQMGKSIDAMMKTLSKDEVKLNEITEYIFDLFEKRSLYKAAEYLALKLLNSDECGCAIRNGFEAKLEGYRKMKKGNIAPDIAFGQNTYFPEGISAKNLSGLDDEYILVVFAASWCSHCIEQIPQISSLYEKWKSGGLEVVLVSLDETVIDFAQFAAGFPFISTTDLKKWESPIAKDYYVNGTPTMYLLDKSRKIQLKPVSVNQVDTWVNLYLSEKLD